MPDQQPSLQLTFCNRIAAHLTVLDIPAGELHSGHTETCSRYDILQFRSKTIPVPDSTRGECVLPGRHVHRNHEALPLEAGRAHRSQ